MKLVSVIIIGLLAVGIVFVIGYTIAKTHVSGTCQMMVQFNMETPISVAEKALDLCPDGSGICMKEKK